MNRLFHKTFNNICYVYLIYTFSELIKVKCEKPPLLLFLLKSQKWNVIIFTNTTLFKKAYPLITFVVSIESKLSIKWNATWITSFLIWFFFWLRYTLSATVNRRIQCMIDQTSYGVFVHKNVSETHPNLKELNLNVCFDVLKRQQWFRYTDCWVQFECARTSECKTSTTLFTFVSCLPESWFLFLALPVTYHSSLNFGFEKKMEY